MARKQKKRKKNEKKRKRKASKLLHNSVKAPLHVFPLDAEGMISVENSEKHFSFMHCMVIFIWPIMTEMMGKLFQ